MTTKEENKTIMEFPLPTEPMVFSTCATADVLKTIVFLEESIQADQAHIDYLKKQLEILKGRVISENVGVQGRYYVLEIVGKKNRNKINNIAEFMKRFPEGYYAIREEQKAALERKYNESLASLNFSEIPLTLADAKIGKDTVTDFVGYQPQTVTIEVRKLPDEVKQIGVLK